MKLIFIFLSYMLTLFIGMTLMAGLMQKFENFGKIVVNRTGTYLIAGENARRLITNGAHHVMVDVEYEE